MSELISPEEKKTRHNEYLRQWRKRNNYPTTTEGRAGWKLRNDLSRIVRRYREELKLRKYHEMQQSIRDQ